MLLFSAIPSIPELGSIPQCKRSEKESKDRTEVVPVPAALSKSEEDSDSSEEPAVVVPKYIPPHRRNRVSLTSKSNNRNGSTEGSTSMVNDSSHHDSLNDFRGSPSVSRNTNSTNVGTEGRFFQTDSSGDSSESFSRVSDRNQSEHSIQPRRSGRTRQAPQLNGDLILNQISVDESEDREYFV